MVSSVAEVAALAGTSAASVTRFCRAIGLSGFPDLRLQLAAELGRSPSAAWTRDLGSGIADDDPPKTVAAVVAAADIQAIQTTAAEIDGIAVTQAADALVAASRILVFGVGGSALVSLEAQFRLSRINRPVWAHLDVHQTMMAASLLGSGDVFWGISRSGRTHEVVDALTTARESGATTVALTSFPRSPLATVADIALITSVQDTETRHGSLAARYAQLLVVDVVYSVVAQHSYSETADALAATTRALVSHRTSRPAHRS